MYTWPIGSFRLFILRLSGPPLTAFAVIQENYNKDTPLIFLRIDLCTADLATCESGLTPKQHTAESRLCGTGVHVRTVWSHSRQPTTKSADSALPLQLSISSLLIERRLKTKVRHLASNLNATPDIGKLP